MSIHDEWRRLEPYPLWERCDACGYAVESVKDAWVEWLIDEQNHLRQIRLVHNWPSCTLHSRNIGDCHVGDHHLYALISDSPEALPVEVVLAGRAADESTIGVERILAVIRQIREYFGMLKVRNPDKSLRFYILKRDNYRCQVCGQSAQEGAQLEVDHRLPYSKGGVTRSFNLWTLCRDCNNGKRAQYL